MKQVRDKGIPSSYHHGKAVSSLVDDCQTMNPPPAVWLEVLHLFRCFTHTCSEISYRITDVECIKRAQTTQLKLTGMVGGFEA